MDKYWSNRWNSSSAKHLLPKPASRARSPSSSMMVNRLMANPPTDWFQFRIFLFKLQRPEPTKKTSLYHVKLLLAEDVKLFQGFNPSVFPLHIRFIHFPISCKNFGLAASSCLDVLPLNTSSQFPGSQHVIWKTLGSQQHSTTNSYHLGRSKEQWHVRPALADWIGNIVGRPLLPDSPRECSPKGRRYPRRSSSPYFGFWNLDQAENWAAAKKIPWQDCFEISWTNCTQLVFDSDGFVL